MEIVVTQIKTERLLLRKFKYEDLKDYIEYRNNKELFTYLSSNPKKEMSEYEISLKSIISGYNSKNMSSKIWAIELMTNKKVIGSVSVESVNDRHNSCEIGWALNVLYQKQGYALESVNALINELFEKYKINRIEAQIWKGNESSIRLAEKLKFSHEGTLREARLKDGKYSDLMVYALLQKDFKNKD